MTGPEIDYAAVFQDLPDPLLLLTPDCLIADVNHAFAQVAGRGREELRGRDVFEAFPDNPADPDATGTSVLRDSLRRVLSTGDLDWLPLQRYDVEVPGRPGVFEERHWCSCNAPVFGPNGGVMLIAIRSEEITDVAGTLTDLRAANA